MLELDAERILYDTSSTECFHFRPVGSANTAGQADGAASYQSFWETHIES
jgi:hypothetical protein